MLDFYLGTDRVTWLAKEEFRTVPLFISHHVLRKRKTFPKAVGSWALDSGGFTQLSRNEDGWPAGCEEPYVEKVYEYREKIGGLSFASQQDWMVEPWLLHGRTVEEHQEKTIANYLRLVELAPDLPWLPVIQGWELDDYHECIDMYGDAGIDLRTHSVVGIGSVCRRQRTSEIGEIVSTVASRGLRLHGFGVKIAGLRKYSDHLTSADSMAWSYAARYEEGPLPGCEDKHKGKCNHCPIYALKWRDKVLASIPNEGSVQVRDEILTTVREANIDPSLGGPYYWVRNERNTLELFHKRDLLALGQSEVGK